jgi:hypothetical protein
MNSEKAQKELCKLLDEVDTEAMLCAMVGLGVRLSSNETEYGHNAALIEIIAFNAIPRFGKNTGKPINNWDFHRCHDLAEKSLKEVMDKSSGVRNDSQNICSISNQLKIYSDVVRGSENSEQLKQKILEIQGHFDKWFNANAEISPSKAIELIFSLANHLELSYKNSQDKCKEYAEQQREKYTRLKRKSKKQLDVAEKNILENFKDADALEAFEFFNKCNEIMPLVLPINIEKLETEAFTTKQEGDALKKLVGISKETINENIEIQRFPLYILNSGKVIFSNLNNLLDILFDAFEFVAKSDHQFYNRYQKHKAKWLEKKSRDYLERIFPKDCIYETLDYPNPDKSGTAELDIAILWSPFILLIEAKAKQFRFESLRGDIGRLRTDLKDNIEEAYEQSVRATKYINAGEKSIFTERGTGRKLEINKNSIIKIYPISLTLNNFAGVTTQLSATKELGLFKNGCYPFSICISELDLITKSNISPDIFLHFIEKRLEVLNTGEWLGYEMDLFVAYLRCRLNRENVQDYHKPGSRYFCESFYGHPCPTSGKNYATAYACGGPSRPASFVGYPTRGIQHHSRNDSTRCRESLHFHYAKNAS